MTDNGSRMSIGELASVSGLTTHALRYYEDQGLIPRVERSPAGHRRYRLEHVQWVGLLERLRASGMSMARIRQYVRLAVAGDRTASARRELLAAHEADVRARIAELKRCLAIVRAKIDLYDGRCDAARVWRLVAEAQRRNGGKPSVRACLGAADHGTGPRPALVDVIRGALVHRS